MTPKPSPPRDTALSLEELRREGRVFATCLVRTAVPDELIERYVQAHQFLLREKSSAADAKMVSFAARHRLVAPCLDAAAALLLPNALLRRKMQLMAAILEASPFGASHFLPRTAGAPRLAALVAWLGLVSAGQLLVGLPLWWLLRKGRA